MNNIYNLRYGFLFYPSCLRGECTFEYKNKKPLRYTEHTKVLKKIKYKKLIAFFVSSD